MSSVMANSKIKKIAIVMGVFIIGGFAWKNIIYNSSDLIQESVSKPQSTISKREKRVAILHKTDYDLSILAEKRKRDKLSDTKAMQVHQLFEAYTLDDALEELDTKAGILPVGAVRKSIHALEKVEVGDYVVLPELEENRYTFKVEHRRVTSRGNISIDGTFEENGIRYTAIMTEGAKHSFITIRTPLGNYEVEFVYEKGLVYTSSDINRVMTHAKESDGIKIF